MQFFFYEIVARIVAIYLCITLSFSFNVSSDPYGFRLGHNIRGACAVHYGQELEPFFAIEVPCTRLFACCALTRPSATTA